MIGLIFRPALHIRDWLSSCRTSDISLAATFALPPPTVPTSEASPVEQSRSVANSSLKHHYYNISPLQQLHYWSICFQDSPPSSCHLPESNDSFQTKVSLGPVISLCIIPKWSASSRLWAKYPHSHHQSLHYTVSFFSVIHLHVVQPTENPLWQAAASLNSCYPMKTGVQMSSIP